MPNETPVDKKEIADKPSPVERVDSNDRASIDLEKSAFTQNITKRKEKFVDDFKREADNVIDEGNRGEEAWHDAHRRRNALTETERKSETGKKVDQEIDATRNGNIEGKKRKYSPSDIVPASNIKDWQKEKVGVQITHNPE